MNLLADILAHYNYWVVVALIMLGMYMVMGNPNLVKKVIGLNVFQTAVFIFYISLGEREGGTAPILAEGYTLYVPDGAEYLFLTIPDSFYGDNSGEVSVRITINGDNS